MNALRLTRTNLRGRSAKAPRAKVKAEDSFIPVIQPTQDDVDDVYHNLIRDNIDFRRNHSEI